MIKGGLSNRKNSFLIFAFFAILFFCPNYTLVLADELSSSSYTILEPVIKPSSFSSSTGFQLWSTISEIALGTSSITSFQLGSGFLRFPFASTPTVSATAGDTQVSLSWTSSEGFGGWTASGYNVGQATVAGGPYSYTSVGNVTSSTRTGLTNDTTYYFVIIVKDAFGNPIATSTEVSAQPASSGGGGGGGGTIPPTGETAVIFSGRAYPLSKVNFLKDGQLILTTIAGPDSNFTATVKDLSAGNYTFSVYGEDNVGRHSSYFTFPIYITAGVITKISGIFIAPTIAVDKSEVKRGDNIIIFGQSANSAEVIISINSEQEFFEKTPSDQNGIYLHNLDSSILELGKHLTKSKASLKGEISSFSNTVSFLVGNKNVFIGLEEKPKKCDLNEDGRCNLIDFSIAAYWYKRPLTPVFIIREKKHLNGDGRVDLVDFSIMAYYWTG